MAIKYNLTPIEILKLFGYTEPIAKETFEKYEKKNNIKLPTLLFDFLSLAYGAPLFETADIWAQYGHYPYFSYESIEEGIEDCQEDFDDPEFCAQNAFYPFSKIPKEKWHESVANYLQIGSDYSVGMIVFGIEEKDLTLENPPIYYQHEADELTAWKLFSPTLSDFLMTVLLDILDCADYGTAEYALSGDESDDEDDSENNGGWCFCEYEFANEKEMIAYLSEKNIDFSAMAKYQAFCGGDAFYRCCFDEEEKAFYVMRSEVHSPDASIMLIQTK